MGKLPDPGALLGMAKSLLGSARRCEAVSLATFAAFPMMLRDVEAVVRPDETVRVGL